MIANQKPTSWWRSGPASVVVVVLLVMMFVAGLYAGKFWWGVQDSELASSPTLWGAFGDYFGGLLNPVVALAALALLAYSISLQKAELKEARDALKAQAHSSNQLVELNALTIVIAGRNDEIVFLDALIAKHQALVDVAVNDERRKFEEANVAHFQAHKSRVRTQKLAYNRRAKELMDQIATTESTATENVTDPHQI